MREVVSREKSSQNVRVAARSRLLAAPPDSEAPADAWLPSRLTTATESPVEPAESVPVDPVAAAELGAQVERLRAQLTHAEKRAAEEGKRAERAEREVGRLTERIEAMKRAAAQAAVVAHPGGDEAGADGRLDLNTASFEQLRALGLSVTQAGRVIGQREQHGGFQSAEDVDAIVGIPKGVKEVLKQQRSV
jgi:DNA uptake protein ComE-like DNA-binding protein